MDQQCQRLLSQDCQCQSEHGEKWFSRRGNAMCLRLEKNLYEREREHLALNHHAIVSVADGDGIIIHANERFFSNLKSIYLFRF